MNTDDSVNCDNSSQNIVVLDNQFDKSTRINHILDHVQNCPAVFKNQQRGDPDLSVENKRSLAKALLEKSPANFLLRFGRFLTLEDFDYFFSVDDPDVQEPARLIKSSYHEANKKLQQKNRRYEALLRLEEEGSYFSESEMEKRDPLLYHQLVGQYLTENEKIIKNRVNNANVIPTFSNYLINKMERDEIATVRKMQLEEESKCDVGTSDEEEEEEKSSGAAVSRSCWGDDWVDNEKSRKKKLKKNKKIHLSSKEKALLLEEFKSLMHSKFLNGLEPEFDYSEVDMNPEYDSLCVRSQDEEDKYFDEESCSDNVCTDTGIEDY